MSDYDMVDMGPQINAKPEYIDTGTLILFKPILAIAVFFLTNYNLMLNKMMSFDTGPPHM
jgi:hypothetical protein